MSFSFGAPGSGQPQSQQPAFNFGAYLAQQAHPPQSGFSFGTGAQSSTTAAAASTTSGFGFGQQPQQQQSAMFGFGGQPKQPPTAIFGQPTVARQPQPFGLVPSTATTSAPTVPTNSFSSPLNFNLFASSSTHSELRESDYETLLKLLSPNREIDHPALVFLHETPRRNFTLKFREQVRNILVVMNGLVTQEYQQYRQLFELFLQLFRHESNGMKLILHEKVDVSKGDGMENTFLGLILKSLNRHCWFRLKMGNTTVPNATKRITSETSSTTANTFGFGPATPPIPIPSGVTFGSSNLSPPLWSDAGEEMIALGQIVLGLKQNLMKYGFKPIPSPPASISSPNEPVISSPITINDVIPSVISISQPSPSAIATLPQSTRLHLDRPLLVGTYHARGLFTVPDWPNSIEFISAVPLDDGIHQFVYGQVHCGSFTRPAEFVGWSNQVTGQLQLMGTREFDGDTLVVPYQFKGTVAQNSSTNQWCFVGESISTKHRNKPGLRINLHLDEWDSTDLIAHGGFKLILDEATLHPSAAPLTPDIEEGLQRVKQRLLQLSTSINSTNQMNPNQMTHQPDQTDLMKPKPTDLIPSNRLMTHPLVLCILEFGRSPLSTLIQPMMELFQILLQSSTAIVVDGEKGSLSSESAISLTPISTGTNMSVKSNVGIMTELEFAFLRLFQLNPGITKELLPFIRLFRQHGIKPREVVKEFKLLTNDSIMGVCNEKDQRPINMWVYFSQWVTLGKIEFLLRWLLEEPNLCDLYDPNYRLDWGDGHGEQTILSYITHLKDQHPHHTPLQVYYQLLLHLSTIVGGPVSSSSTSLVDELTLTDSRLNNNFDVDNESMMMEPEFAPPSSTIASSSSSSSSSTTGNSSSIKFDVDHLIDSSCMTAASCRTWMELTLQQIQSPNQFISARLLERLTQPFLITSNSSVGVVGVKLSTTTGLTPSQKSSLHETVSELLVAVREQQLNLLEEDAYGNILLHSILSLPSYELIRLKAVEKQFFQKLDHLPPTIISDFHRRLNSTLLSELFSETLLFDSINPLKPLPQNTIGLLVGNKIFPIFHLDTLRLEVTGMQWFQIGGALSPTLQLWDVRTKQVLAEIVPNPTTIQSNAFNVALFRSPVVLTADQHSMGVIGTMCFWTEASVYPIATPNQFSTLLKPHPDYRLDEQVHYHNCGSGVKSFPQSTYKGQLYLVAPIVRKVILSSSTAPPHTQPITATAAGGGGFRLGGFPAPQQPPLVEMPGTRHRAFQPLIESSSATYAYDLKTITIQSAYQSITCLPEYESKTFEELRCEDDALGGLATYQLPTPAAINATFRQQRSTFDQTSTTTTAAPIISFGFVGAPATQTNSTDGGFGFGTPTTGSVGTGGLFTTASTKGVSLFDGGMIATSPNARTNSFIATESKENSDSTTNSTTSSSSSSSTAALPNVENSNDKLTLISKPAEVVYAPITPSLLYGQAIPSIQIGLDGQVVTVTGNGSQAPLDILFTHHSPYPMGEFIYQLFDRLLSKALVLVGNQNPTVEALIKSNSIGNIYLYYSQLISSTTDVTELHASLNLFQSHTIHPAEATFTLPDVFTSWIQSGDLNRIQQWFIENHSTDALWPTRLGGDGSQRNESLLETAKRLEAMPGSLPSGSKLPELVKYLQLQYDRWHDLFIPLIRMNVTELLIPDLTNIVMDYLIPGLCSSASASDDESSRVGLLSPPPSLSFNANDQEMILQLTQTTGVSRTTAINALRQAEGSVSQAKALILQGLVA